MRYKKVNIILLEERGIGLLKRNIVQVKEGVGDYTPTTLGLITVCKNMNQTHKRAKKAQ